jgi:hypothetical protein
MATPMTCARSLPILLILAGAVGGRAGAADFLVFDVGATGTNQIEECYIDGNCYQYRTVGDIGLALEATRPRLENINSLLLEPPGAPSPASGFAWSFLSYAIGQYLSDPSLPDVSMHFFPNPVIDTPGILLGFDAQLTENRTKLTLSGHFPELAGHAIGFPSIEFSVVGLLVPEPASASIAALAIMGPLASRRCLRFRRRRARIAP